MAYGLLREKYWSQSIQGNRVFWLVCSLTKEFKKPGIERNRVFYWGLKTSYWERLYFPRLWGRISYSSLFNKKDKLIRDRLIGRTPSFEVVNRGSSPRPETKFYGGYDVMVASHSVKVYARDRYPLTTPKHLWQWWFMYRTENPRMLVRFQPDAPMMGL